MNPVATVRRSLSHVRAEWKARRELARRAAALRRAIRTSRDNLRIVFGASGTEFAGWVSTEYPIVDISDRASLARYFRAGRVRAILAEHVWEHLDPAQARTAADNAFWLLAPGGHARIAVPDGLHADPAYIEYVRPGGHGPGSDDHKMLYDFRTLTGLLEAAGFRTRLLEWFDAERRFHFEEWDRKDGFIWRSTRYDERNAVNPTAYTSLIVDAIKPD